MFSFNNWVEAVFNGETFEVAREGDSNSSSSLEENCSNSGTTNTEIKTASASKSSNEESVYFLDNKVDGSRYRKTGKVPREFNKLMILFIGDLLQAEVLPVTYGTSLQFFEHNKLGFFKVMVRGRIDRMYPYKDRYSIEIDDGTGRITCMFTNEDRTKELRKSAEEEMHLTRDLFLQDPSDNLLKASYVLAKKSFELMNSAPPSCDLRCNDTVVIIGNMKEYKGDRYIYVDKHRKDDNPKVFFENNKKHLLTYLYDNFYNLQKQDRGV